MLKENPNQDVIDLKQMKLHVLKKIRLDSERHVWILRVPNGWIYYHGIDNSGTFVPEQTNKVI